MRKCNTYIVVFFIALLLVCYVPLHVNGVDLTTCTQAEVYESTTTSLRQMSYRLLVPENYDKSRSYNLLVYFHDTEGRGSDNTASVAYSEKLRLLQQLTQSKAYSDVFVLIPQCPSEESWVRLDPSSGKYTFYADGQTPAQEIFMELLQQQILQKYSIDSTHISLLGVGEGGTMVFDLLGRYADTFMSGISVGGAADASLAKQYAAQNLRAYYASEDTDTVKVAALRMLQTALTDSKTASVTEVIASEQMLYTKVFADDALLQWALSLAAPEEVTENVPESTANLGAAKQDAMQSAADAESKEPVYQTQQSFFERYEISQRTIVLVLLGIALLASLILLLIGYQQTKPR